MTTLLKARHIIGSKGPNPDNQIGGRQHFLPLG